MILFVDCDSTLVLWNEKQVDGIWMRDTYCFNQRLVDAINNFRQTNDCEGVIVWSGGGQNYAEGWCRKLDKLDAAFHLGKLLGKFDPTSSGDLLIDDEPLVARGAVISWQDFVEVYGEAKS